MPEASESTSLVGRRISMEGKHATVLFEGTVGDTKGTWLGVEWDDPSRGKHNGTHNGIRIFEPRSDSPTSSSFLRHNKVNLGIDIVEGIKRRYGRVEGETAGVELDTIVNLKNEIGARFVQVVGFDKVNAEQCQFSKLRTASVRDMNVNDVYVNLAAEFPSLLDLDLSENLVGSWSQLATVISQIPLRVLTVSRNKMSIPVTFPSASFQHLTHLVMGGLGYTWEEVENVAGDLPNLEILQVHDNQIKEIKISENKFSSLQELDLDGNVIDDWSEVCNLSKLNSLRRLRVNKNKISSLKHTTQLSNLTLLQLSHNLIANWAEVGRLNNLKIEDFRMRNNPVFKGEKEADTRSILIALIKSLIILNGSSITESERKWAEIDYYKKFGIEYLNIKKLPEEERTKAMEEFTATHSRYLELVERFGEPVESELVVKEHNLKATLVSIVVRCPDLIGSADVTKKLPLSMTVSKLQTLLRRLYRSNMSSGAELQLSVVRPGGDGQEQVLDNQLRDLSYYSFEKGDVLLVRW